MPKKTKKSIIDIYGTNQRELWEHIQSENLATAAYKLAVLIRKITESTTGEIILHRTSKIILKRKKRFRRSIERCATNYHNTCHLHGSRQNYQCLSKK